VKREVLPKAGFSADSGFSFIDPEKEPEHLKILKAKLEAMPADEFLETVRGQGWEKAAKATIDKAEFLRGLEERDPMELRKIREVLVREGKLEELVPVEKGDGGSAVVNE